MSEGLQMPLRRDVSKTAWPPYERDARANTQRRSEVKAMSEPVFDRVNPSEEAKPFYIVQEKRDVPYASAF
jgi:hypothetical protein